MRRLFVSAIQQTMQKASKQAPFQDQSGISDCSLPNEWEAMQSRLTNLESQLAKVTKKLKVLSKANDKPEQSLSTTVSPHELSELRRVTSRLETAFEDQQQKQRGFVTERMVDEMLKAFDSRIRQYVEKRIQEMTISRPVSAKNPEQGPSPPIPKNGLQHKKALPEYSASKQEANKYSGGLQGPNKSHESHASNKSLFQQTSNLLRTPQKSENSSRPSSKVKDARTPSEYLMAYTQSQSIPTVRSEKVIMTQDYLSPPKPPAPAIADASSMNRVHYLKQKLKHFEEVNRKYETSRQPPIQSIQSIEEERGRQDRMQQNKYPRDHSKHQKKSSLDKMEAQANMYSAKKKKAQEATEMPKYKHPGSQSPMSDASSPKYARDKRYNQFDDKRSDMDARSSSQRSDSLRETASALNKLRDFLSQSNSSLQVSAIVGNDDY